MADTSIQDEELDENAGVDKIIITLISELIFIGGIIYAVDTFVPTTLFDGTINDEKIKVVEYGNIFPGELRVIVNKPDGRSITYIADKQSLEIVYLTIPNDEPDEDGIIRQLKIDSTTENAPIITKAQTQYDNYLRQTLESRLNTRIQNDISKRNNALLESRIKKIELQTLQNERLNYLR